MAMDGVLTDDQPFGDATIRQSISEESQHLALAFAELVQRVNGCAGWNDRTCGKCRQHALGPCLLPAGIEPTEHGQRCLDLATGTILAA